MWKEDPTASFYEDDYLEYSGFFDWKGTRRTRYYFSCHDAAWADPTGYRVSMDRARYITPEQFRSLNEKTHETPVAIHRKGVWTWWLYGGYFFRDNEPAKVYSAEEVKAILEQKIRRQQRTVRWAVAQMNQEPEDESPRRPPIPDDVKFLVWRRDRGRCARCGGQENLEFDHVIPFSQGGSSTARNLQLLCERCNRSNSPWQKRFFRENEFRYQAT